MPYFDHNATTPLDPRVRDAMLPWLDAHHGNPSSAHRAGREARAAVDRARAQVAALVGGRPEDVVFTASGTEANNTVLAGLGELVPPGRVVLSILEHPSVRRAADRLLAHGWAVDQVAPGADGRLDPDRVEEVFRDDTRVVCVMLANNELGTIQPVAAIAHRARARGIAVLCDAVQAAGKIAIDVEALGVDYLTVGGHKFHGPMGGAALWIRPGAALSPLLLGAPQEGGRRASTENVPAVVGLGEAGALATAELAERAAHLGALRERFESGLRAIDGARVHCAASPRLPHTSHVAFEGVSGHALMLALDAADLAVSTGAACHSGRPQPSAALLEMGVDEAEALASLRVSFGMPNTAEEVDRLLAALGREVASLRQPVAAPG